MQRSARSDDGVMLGEARAKVLELERELQNRPNSPGEPADDSEHTGTRDISSAQKIHCHRLGMEEMDANRDGRVTREEWAHATGGLEGFAEADTDGEGEVSTSEYDAWIASPREGTPPGEAVHDEIEASLEAGMMKAARAHALFVQCACSEYQTVLTELHLPPAGTPGRLPTGDGGPRQCMQRQRRRLHS